MCVGTASRPRCFPRSRCCRLTNAARRSLEKGNESLLMGGRPNAKFVGDSLGRRRALHASPQPDMTMRTGILALFALLVVHSQHARAQQVVIHSVAPTAVVQGLSAQLEPQGYTLVTSDTKKAAFTRAAAISGLVPYDHAVDQLTFRFKQTVDGVVVAVSEEIVMLRNGGVFGRMPLDNHRDQLQQLLDNARAELESERPLPDSTGKYDSTSVNHVRAVGEPSPLANDSSLDSLTRAGVQTALRSNLEDPALLSALLHRLADLSAAG